MESPVIVENYSSYSDNNNTGFPFDDTDYDSNDRLRSTLDDIAQRHPEFADSLSFDFPSLRRKRFGSGSSSSTDENREQTPKNTHKPGQSSRSFDIPERSRFGDHSFPSGFNRFPFTRHFDDFDEDLSAEKPPEVPRESRGETKKVPKKVPNPNLPQHLSNTVDLGQKQTPVEEVRGQRSMSAPPENRNFRNSSERDMGGYMSSNTPQKPAQQNAPRERIIPIHVEGRDEPIIPKNVNFDVKKSDSKEIPIKVSHEKARQTPPTTHQAPPQFQQAPPTTGGPQREATPPKQKTPPPSAINKNDPLEKIKSVKSDVLNLMEQVENFTGTRKDKLYSYLDEMLTVNLIKLDDVETDGKDNIRVARKEAIKCIQECIAKLESKAQQNEQKPTDTTSESQEVQQNVSKNPSETSIGESKSPSKPKFKSTASIELQLPTQMEVETSSSTSAEATSQENMEVDPQSNKTAEQTEAQGEQNTQTMEVENTNNENVLTKNASQANNMDNLNK